MLKLAHPYSAEIDDTISRITLLFNVFYRPVIVIDDKGQVKNMAWVWTSPEAEKTCHILSQRLAKLAEEQHKILNKDTENEQQS